MDNKNIADKIKQDLQPSLDSFTKMLLEGLIEDNIIIKKSSSGDGLEESFEIAAEVKDRVHSDPDRQLDNRQVNSFRSFKRATIEVFENLGYDAQANTSSHFIAALEKFAEIGVLKLNANVLESLKGVFHKGIRSEDELDEELIRILKKKNLNFSVLTNRLLEFFVEEKLTVHFTGVLFANSRLGGKVVDFVIKSTDVVDLLFEVRYRKASRSAVKDIITQGIDLLIAHKNETQKNGFLTIILFSEDDTKEFERINYIAKETIQQLFLEYSRWVILIPISIFELKHLDSKLGEIRGPLEISPLEILFADKPRIISFQEEVTIQTNFLSTDLGSFATWVKLDSQSFDTHRIYKYVISHATNQYLRTADKKYANVFSVALAPHSSFEGNKKSPQMSWRVWTSNGFGDDMRIYGPVISDKLEKWYHLLVRWNYNVGKLEFYINGELMGSNNQYRMHWPSEATGKMFLGTWGNKASSHYLNQPLFRTICTSKFLDDEWLKNEVGIQVPK